MSNTVTGSAIFTPEMAKDVFSMVKGHSSVVKLCANEPLSQSGEEIMTFSLDDEVSIVGEGENSQPGKATTGTVKQLPLRIEYNHRLSDEFLRVDEERGMEMLKTLNDGLAKKIARGIDIMVFHGVNPKDKVASGKIGDNHLDTVASVEYTEGLPESALEDAVAAVGENDVTGYVLSKSLGTDLGKYKESGVSQYPEFKLGGNPGKLGGTACDINTTVTAVNDDTAGYVGDFANSFKWGYSDRIHMEVIQYGDPDGQGDLKRMHQVLVRCEASVGWAILNKAAFSRIVKKAAD